MNGQQGLIGRQGNWASQLLLQPVHVPSYVGIIAIVAIVAFFWTRVLRHIVE